MFDDSIGDILGSREGRKFRLRVIINLFINPRKAFRILAQGKFNNHTLGLIVFISLFNMYQGFRLFDYIGFQPIHIARENFDVIWIISSFLLGWLPYFLIAVFLYWKNQGRETCSITLIFRVLLLSSIPTLFVFLLDSIESINLSLIVFLNCIFYIWSVVLMIIGVSEIQKITILQAASSVMIALSILVVIGFVLLNLVALI